MVSYNDTILVDVNLNRVTSIPIDYYTIDTVILWVGYVYNDTGNNIENCKIATSSTYDGVFAISGGVTGYQSVTSDWGTTCTIGQIISGGTKQIVMRTFVAGGSSLTGAQTAPLYISK